MRRNAVFIGENFTDSQLLWVIPIATAFAEHKGSRVIWFDRKVPHRILGQPSIQRALSPFDVVYMRPQQKIFLALCVVPFLLFSLWRLFSLSFVRREDLLCKEISWDLSQLRHAVWDTAMASSRDGTLVPPLFRRFGAAFKVYYQYQVFGALQRRFIIDGAFLGHTVYRARATYARLRKSTEEIFIHGHFCIFRGLAKRDLESCSLSCSEWGALKSSLDPEMITDFWVRRKDGDSKYEDARRAAYGKGLDLSVLPRNLMFLHVFRDSPFHRIDRSRIFSDYVDWCLQSVQAITQGSENWMLKFHPSASRWGENSQLWLSFILKNLGLKSLPANIAVDFGDISNLALLKNARRVVTFRGTVHLEAACFGIRPIVVSEVPLSDVCPGAVLIPRTLTSYKKLLASPSTSDQFRLSVDEVLEAKNLLFFREECLSLKELVGAGNLYRGDAFEVFERDFENVSGAVGKVEDDLKKMGINLALRKAQRTTYQDFMRT